tara:strand:- start:326 stop:808 length:483 start_codon:yes stop_codon:yes gene_type:complete
MSNTLDTSQKAPPDAEIILRKWALGQSAITDITGNNIATRLPREANLPFLTLYRAGGQLINPLSEAHIQAALMPMDCFAGKWGGASNTGTPDYGKAMDLANAVIQSAFNYSNGYITSDDATPLRAKIYGFQIMQMPTRVEETATGLGRYSLALSMMYRAV